jgi:hypothetical protein
MESLREKFAVFDLNGDGVLTRDEIRQILTRPSGGARTSNIPRGNRGSNARHNMPLRNPSPFGFRWIRVRRSRYDHADDTRGEEAGLMHHLCPSLCCALQ